MKTDKEKYGLNGPVKSVLTETAEFEPRDGQIVEKPLFSYSQTFNTAGQLIEQVHRNPDGSEWRAVNDYSDAGNLLATRTLDHTGTMYSEVRYSYDDHERLAAEEYVARDGSVSMPATYAYDDAGGKVKIQELDSQEKTNMMIGIEESNTMINAGDATRVESRYDDRGSVIDVRLFNSDGAIVSRVEITRDARGNSLEETQYIGDAFPVGACAYEASSPEEMATLSQAEREEIEAEFARLFSAGTTMSKHQHTYDTEGRLIESKLTMMGTEVSRQTFAYDEHGNKSEEMSYNAEGTLAGKTLFTRDYDEHGNWTRELVSTVSTWDAEFGLSTPAHVTHRRITYWK